MFKIFIYSFLLINLISKYAVSQHEINLELFFSSGSFILSQEEKAKQTSFIRNLDFNLISSISIYGYCDDKASTQFNDFLSLKRAIYVRNLAMELGVKNELINKVEGRGELPLRNIESKDSVQQRSLNRMVKIIVQRKSLRNPLENSDLTVLQNDTMQEHFKKTFCRKTLRDDLRVGDTVVFDAIQFLDNRHKIHPKSYPALDSIVKNLKMKPQYDILIMGHICCVAPDYAGHDALDTDTGIENLSTARAKAVVDYLVKKGIKSKRLTYIGLRGFYPTGKGEFFDRRIEIKITNIEY